MSSIDCARNDCYDCSRNEYLTAEPVMRVSKEQAAKNREKILDAASKMFRRQGIDGLGVADLMQETGLTHGALYSHFNSKEELLSESCSHAMTKAVARWKKVADEAEGESSFAAIVRFYLSKLHREKVDQGCMIAALTTEFARRNAATRHAFTESLRPFVELLTQHAGMRSAAAGRKKAMLTMSAMLGALILARAVDDPLLSDEFLESVAEDLTGGTVRQSP
jgi:TetR/AcrR family transcriptional repressor of nem operon